MLFAGALACAPAPAPEADVDARCFDPRTRDVHFPPCTAGEWPGHNGTDGFIANAPPAALRVRWTDEPGWGVPVVLTVLTLSLVAAIAAARARRPEDAALDVMLAGAGVASLLAVTFTAAIIAIGGILPSVRLAVSFAAMFFSLTLPAALAAWFGIVRCLRAGDDSGEWAVGLTALAWATAALVFVLWYLAQPAARLLLL